MLPIFRVRTFYGETGPDIVIASGEITTSSTEISLSDLRGDASIPLLAAKEVFYNISAPTAERAEKDARFQRYGLEIQRRRQRKEEAHNAGSEGGS